MMRKLLLVSCVLAAALYTTMVIVAGMLYPGYDSTAQVVSELSAVGAPTAALWTKLGAVYLALMLAFGWGSGDRPGTTARSALSAP